MKNQPYFPYGLLFSVAPENFFSLYQIDETSYGEFVWGTSKSHLTGLHSVQVVFNYLKTLRECWKTAGKHSNCLNNAGKHDSRSN